MNRDTLSALNDAADANCNARAMVWAVFHMAEGMRRDGLSDAISACCTQALERLNESANLLEQAASAERGERSE